MKNKAAQELRAIPSELRAQTSRENGKKGGRPCLPWKQWRGPWTDKEDPAGLDEAVSEALAQGHGKIVPRLRLKRDDCEVVVDLDEGHYRVRAKWPWDAETHQVKLYYYKL